MLYNHAVLYLQSENDFENTLMNSHCFRSRIAFEETKNIGGNSVPLVYDYLHWDDWIVSKKVFAVRRLVDFYVYSFDGALPLHAAGVIKDGYLTLFFGDSNGGKSYKVNQLSTRSPEYTIVGDDHIIINTVEMCVFGNHLMRLRNDRKSGLDIYKELFSTCMAYEKVEISYSGDETEPITKYMTAYFKPEVTNPFSNDIHYNERYIEDVKMFLRN